LSVDFSKKSTGLAFGRPGELPRLSSRGFAPWEGASLSECASAVIRWLPELLSTYQPDLVVIEAALPPAASRDQISARLALGADFVIKGACHIRGIRCVECHNGTWKAWFLGTSRLKSDRAKQRAIEICQSMGMSPKNGDEADAAAIWFWACSTYAGHHNDAMLPLLAKAQRTLEAA